MTRADAITIIKDLDADKETLATAKIVLYDIGYSLQQVDVLRADYGEHTAQNVQKDTTGWVVESMLTGKLVKAIVDDGKDIDPIVTEAIKVHYQTAYARPSSNMPGNYDIDWTWLKNAHGIRFPYMGINNY